MQVLLPCKNTFYVLYSKPIFFLKKNSHLDFKVVTNLKIFLPVMLIILPTLRFIKNLCIFLKLRYLCLIKGCCDHDPRSMA